MEKNFEIVGVRNIKNNFLVYFYSEKRIFYFAVVLNKNLEVSQSYTESKISTILTIKSEKISLDEIENFLQIKKSFGFFIGEKIHTIIKNINLVYFKLKLIF